MRWEPDPEDDAADPATGEALCEDGTQAAENVKMPPAGRHLKEEFLCHTRELKKVRAFIRKRRNKGKFEALFLQHFEKMIRLATRAAEQLETSGYETLYEQSICGKRLAHGDYNYHNVLMPAGVHGTSDGWGCRERVATTGFEHFRMDVQALDLYYFLRKVMEKHHWDVKFGDAMLEMYSRIRPLSQAEIEYISLKLIYPEKYWKVANAYYQSNKAWIPEKSVEKLETAIRQTEEKMRFVEQIFAFHL